MLGSHAKRLDEGHRIDRQSLESASAVRVKEWFEIEQRYAQPHI